MPFAFSFQFSFPGISNPFSTFTSTPSEPPVEQRSESKPRLISEAAHADSSPLFSPAPAYRRRPSPSPSPALNAPSRKRGWVPAEAEPSPATIMTASTSGFLDTPAKYRDLAASQGDDDGEEVVVDLPPAKRRKGITGSVISTAFSAALIGAAVGFTVYRMWRDRGKEPEQPPPPPYQEEWVDARLPETPPAEKVATEALSSRAQRARLTPSNTRRHVASTRHRKTPTRTRIVRAPKESSSRAHVPSIVSQGPDQEEQDDELNQIDWIGGKLAQLIEEGKRALGTEIVVSSDAPEDEIDDGSGNWADELQTLPGSSTSYASRSRSPKKLRSSTSRPSELTIPRTSTSFSSSSHIRNLSSDSPVPQTSLMDSRFCFDSNAVSVPTSSRSDGFSSCLPSSLDSRETESDWGSPQLRASMERARAAYHQRR